MKFSETQCLPVWHRDSKGLGQKVVMGIQCDKYQSLINQSVLNKSFSVYSGPLISMRILVPEFPWIPKLEDAQVPYVKWHSI